jgi:hypothetical protein
MSQAGPKIEELMGWRGEGDDGGLKSTASITINNNLTRKG